MRALRSLVFLVGSILLVPLCYAQCDVKIEFSHKKKSDSNFSIYLKPEVHLKNVQVQLYDLYEGKVVKEATINALTGLLDVEVFTEVKPSLYYVYIKFEGCDRKGLGGASGFIVGDK